MAGQSSGTGAVRRGGFTLIELLVVIVIIGLVSAVALPAILPALQHRQVSEAGRILQGALVGARDKAIHDGQPSGIRLLPDPVFFHGTATITSPDGTTTTVQVPLRDASGRIASWETLAYSRIMPIDPAPEYQEGMVTVRVGTTAANYAAPISNPLGVNLAAPTLVLEEAPADKHGAPNPPTSWYWNVRVGDKVQINNAGPWYTVVGPMVTGPAGGNAELFVNVGPPGTASPLNPSGSLPIDYLILTNGIDDNHNGWVDEGWDGVDNDGNGLTDEHTQTAQGLVSEWEMESWHGAAAAGMFSQPYAVRRRPMPSPNAREVALPTSMVIDAATALLGTRERSRLPVNGYTGAVEVMINPDGTVAYSSPYGPPSSFKMGDTFYHFWLAERQDVVDVATTSANGATVAAPVETIGGVPHYLPVARPSGAGAAYSLPTLKGDYSLLTLFSRTGQIVVTETPAFDDPVAAAAAPRAYDPGTPFVAPQQGLR